MKKCFGHIIAMAVSALVFLASCNNDRAELIPREDMAQIYAEMLLTDQWIVNTPNMRMIADTSLVYTPILEKYGYDAADYRESVDRYMDEPEDLAEILEASVEILNLKMEDLERRKKELARLANKKAFLERYRPKTKWDEVFPEMPDHDYVGTPDSLAVYMDSIGRMVYEYKVRVDTTYEGPAMVLPEVDTATAVQPDTSSHALKPVLEPLVSKNRAMNGQKLQKKGNEHK